MFRPTDFSSHVQRHISEVSKFQRH